MTLPVIHFPRARYWVETRALYAYIYWCWRVSQQEGNYNYRLLIRHLWRPTPFVRIPNFLVQTYSLSKKLGIKPGWTRYPTNGTRLHVFDAKEPKICKILLPNVHSSSLSEELIVRKKVGDLAPPILAVNYEANAYVENRIFAHQPAYSMVTLQHTLLQLQNMLYHIEWINMDQFLVTLKRWGKISNEMLHAIHIAFTNMGDEGRVPWSMVHGDLVGQNLLLNKAHEIILIDWEYTRECIATYDCWLYQYHHVCVQECAEVSEFCERFGRSLTGLAGIDEYNLNPFSLHILHLIERVQYLNHVSPHTTDHIRKLMTSDIQYALNILNLNKNYRNY